MKPGSHDESEVGATRTGASPAVQEPGGVSALEAATEHQPRARAALAAALARGPSHAYLFTGPGGAGKRAAARAFAAELLATAAPGGEAAAEEARRRALQDPSPHPDLVWLRPEGTQHRIEEVREQVIRPSSFHPYEGTRRVFAIEAAEALREESQNALLKTLEEPPPHAHLLLISSEPESLLPTVRSRCQPVELGALPPQVVEATLEAEHGAGPQVRAAARLSAGDLDRARLLLSPTGAELRVAAERFAGSALATSAAEPRDAAAGGAGTAAGDEGTAEPWAAILGAAETAGSEAEESVQRRQEEEAEMGLKLSKTEAGQEARRQGRRARTELLDLGLELAAIWHRDLAAAAEGAGDVVLNTDRQERLAGLAGELDPALPRRCAELVASYRRRLALNVSEELALESLHSALRRQSGR